MDVKWEVEEGELLKDCLEVGAKDLQGLLVIAICQRSFRWCFKSFYTT